MICKYFLPFWTCLSTFLIMFRQDFNVNEVQYISVFSFITLLLILYLRNHCLTQDHKDIHLFYSVSFIALALACRSLICFEWIFVCDMRKGPSFILLCVKLLEHHLLRLFFSCWITLAPFIKLFNHKCVSSFLDSQFCSIGPTCQDQYFGSSWGDSTYILGGERLDSLGGRQHNARLLKYFMRDVQIVCC